METIKNYPAGVQRMRYLLGALGALMVSDGLVSHFLILNGLGREGNPLLEPLVGGAGFLVIKVVGALLCALILWDIYRRRPRLALVSTSCFVVLCGGIVLWNLTIFFAAL